MASVHSELQVSLDSAPDSSLVDEPDSLETSPARIVAKSSTPQRKLNVSELANALSWGRVRAARITDELVRPLAPQVAVPSPAPLSSTRHAIQSAPTPQSPKLPGRAKSASSTPRLGSVGTSYSVKHAVATSLPPKSYASPLGSARSQLTTAQPMSDRSFRASSPHSTSTSVSATTSALRRPVETAPATALSHARVFHSPPISNLKQMAIVELQQLPRSQSAPHVKRPYSQTPSVPLPALSQALPQASPSSAHQLFVRQLASLQIQPASPVAAAVPTSAPTPSPLASRSKVPLKSPSAPAPVGVSKSEVMVAASRASASASIADAAQRFARSTSPPKVCKPIVPVQSRTYASPGRVPPRADISRSLTVHQKDEHTNVGPSSPSITREVPSLITSPRQQAMSKSLPTQQQSQSRSEVPPPGRLVLNAISSYAKTAPVTASKPSPALPTSPQSMRSPLRSPQSASVAAKSISKSVTKSMPSEAVSPADSKPKKPSSIDSNARQPLNRTATAAAARLLTSDHVPTEIAGALCSALFSYHGSDSFVPVSPSSVGSPSSTVSPIAPSVTISVQSPRSADKRRLSYANSPTAASAFGISHNAS